MNRPNPHIGHPPYPSEGFSRMGGRNRDVLRGKRISLDDGMAPVGWSKILDSEKRKWTVD